MLLLNTRINLYKDNLLIKLKIKMDRNTIQKILIGLFLSACIFIGLRTFNVIGFNETATKQK
jgi:hypothetical protein